MSDDKVAIAKLETKIDSIEKKVEKLENGNELLFRLTVVSEQQTELNKKQDIRLENMEATFSEMNLNLSNMNNSQLLLKDSIEKIGNRVDSIEKDLEEYEDKDNVSISEHLKKWAGWILFGLPTMILGAYTLYKLNL